MKKNLSIHFLGAFRIFWNQKEITPLTSKQMEAFLAILFSHKDFCVPKEKLLFLFWGEKEEQKAKHSLRNLIFKLKKEFQSEFPNLINSDRHNVWISFSGIIETDLLTFSKWPSCKNSLEELESIESLFQGKFLDSMSTEGDSAQGFSEWLFQKQNEYQFEHQQLLKRIISLSAEQAKNEKRFHFCKKFLEQYPWDEEIVLEEMKSLYAQQRKAEALQTYLHFEKELKKELQTTPSASLRDFYLYLKQEKVSQVERAVPLQNPVDLLTKNKIPRFSSLYFERKETEKEILDLLLESNTQTILLHGLSGTGKTRLSCHLAERCQPEFPEGVYFVSFADFPSFQTTTTQIFYVFLADKLKLALDKSLPPEHQFIRFFEQKKALFVLDDLPLLPEMDAILSEIIHFLPTVRFLMNSQFSDVLFVCGKKIHFEGFSVEKREPCSEAASFLLFCLEEGTVVDTKYPHEMEKLEEISCSFLQGYPFFLKKIATWFEFQSADEIVAKLSKERKTETFTTPFFSYMEDSWEVLFQEQKEALFVLSFLGGSSFGASLAFEYAGIKPFLLQSLVQGHWIQKEIQQKDFQFLSLNQEFVLKKLASEPERQKELSLHFQHFFLKGYWADKSKEQIGLDHYFVHIQERWMLIQKAFLLALECEEWELLEIGMDKISLYSWRIDSNEQEHFLNLLAQKAEEKKQKEFLKRLIHKHFAALWIDRLDYEQLGKIVVLDIPFVLKKEKLLQAYQFRNNSIYLFVVEGKMEESFQHATLSAKIFKELGFKLEYSYVLESISFYVMKENPEQAEKYFLEMLEISQEITNSDGIARAYRGLFECYGIMKQWQKAEGAIHSFHYYSQLFPNQLRMSQYYTMLATLHIHQKNYDAAIQAFLDAEVATKKTVKKYAVADIWFRLGQLFTKLNDPRALLYLKKALDFYKNVLPSKLKMTCFEWAKYSLKQGNLLEYFRFALPLFSQAFRSSKESDLHELLLLHASYWLAIGKKKQALRWIHFVFVSKTYQPQEESHSEAKKMLRDLSDELGDSFHNIQQKKILLKEIQETMLFEIPEMPIKTKEKACPFCL